MATTLHASARLAIRALLAGLALSGCAAKPRASAAVAPACAGARWVEVRNDLRTSVDVYAYNDDGSRRFLGTVGSGTHRLPLLEPTRHVYAEADGRRLDRAGAASNGVTFTHGCDAG